MAPSDPLETLARDTPLYARKCLKIANKRGKIVPFVLNEGQLSFNAKLEAQRLAGRPQRGVVLKCRQIGFSTLVQAKLLQRTTLAPNQNALVVAHDTKTGDKLYAIGERMYGNLPDEPGLKPQTRAHRRGRFLHFADPGKEAWATGALYPNSTYLVDTASEGEAGRGGTFQLLHLSEFAFWDDPKKKMTALVGGVDDSDPDSLVVIESTPNGMGVFKDVWDDAVAGRSDFAAQFWPWWMEPSYSLRFANEAEREAFIREIGRGPYGDDEPALLEGQPHPDTGEIIPLTYEQLHWRRRIIANKYMGALDRFHQEYPANPEEAFLASGRQVFNSAMVRGILVGCDVTDPRVPTEETPGPEIGSFTAEGVQRTVGRTGSMEVPTGAVWTPTQGISLEQTWKLWLPGREDGKPKPEDQFVVSCDPSGGEITEGSESDYHAIQVIDHRTRRQVAEYRSRIDVDLVAELVYLAALWFNRAWVSVEVTGGWGLPVIRRIFLDYHYPYIYSRRAHGAHFERREDRIGWSTDRRTKPILEAGAAEMLREGSHGIASRALVEEMLSYVRDDKGRTGAEPGRYDDLLVSWMIAHQSALELPLRVLKKRTAPPPRTW